MDMLHIVQGLLSLAEVFLKCLKLLTFKSQLVFIVVRLLSKFFL